ncbi:MAG: hypothetical protein AAGJ69_06355 [Cyanobacteria bacterium J06559_1]
MSKLRLAMEYGADPIWEIFEDGSDNLDHRNLPLSESLKHDLDIWSQCYLDTFDEDYPPDGGFASVAEEKAFEEEGLNLWKRLRQELDPDIQMEPYHTHGAGVAKKALV